MKTIVLMMFLAVGFSETVCMDELTRLVRAGKDAELDEFLKQNKSALRGQEERLVDICLNDWSGASSCTLEVLLKHGGCPRYLSLLSLINSTCRYLLILYGADPTRDVYGGRGFLDFCLSNFEKNSFNLTTICTVVVLRDMHFEDRERQLKLRIKNYAKWVERLLNAPRTNCETPWLPPDMCLEIAQHVWDSEKVALNEQIARWRVYKERSYGWLV